MNHSAMNPATRAACVLSMLTATGVSAAPLCDKSEIRLVNTMREIAQPYHANLDKGGRLFAKWAGLEQRYVLQLNQGDSDRQVSLMRGLLSTQPIASEPAGTSVVTAEPAAMYDPSAKVTGATSVLLLPTNTPLPITV